MPPPHGMASSETYAVDRQDEKSPNKAAHMQLTGETEVCDGTDLPVVPSDTTASIDMHNFLCYFRSLAVGVSALLTLVLTAILALTWICLWKCLAGLLLVIVGMLRKLMEDQAFEVIRSGESNNADACKPASVVICSATESGLKSSPRKERAHGDDMKVTRAGKDRQRVSKVEQSIGVDRQQTPNKLTLEKPQHQTSAIELDPEETPLDPVVSAILATNESLSRSIGDLPINQSTNEAVAQYLNNGSTKVSIPAVVNPIHGGSSYGRANQTTKATSARALTVKEKQAMAQKTFIESLARSGALEWEDEAAMRSFGHRLGRYRGRGVRGGRGGLNGSPKCERDTPQSWKQQGLPDRESPAEKVLETVVLNLKTADEQQAPNIRAKLSGWKPLTPAGNVAHPRQAGYVPPHMQTISVPRMSDEVQTLNTDDLMSEAFDDIDYPVMTDVNTVLRGDSDSIVPSR